MYSLKFVHPKGDSIVSWELDVPYETVVFIDSDGSMAEGFELKTSPEILTIYRGSACLLELRFLLFDLDLDCFRLPPYDSES